jgi:hypothetical protein
LERTCDSTPAGKLPGAPPKNRAIWSSVEINVGFKNKYISYFYPNITKLMMMAMAHQATTTMTTAMVLMTMMAMATAMATAAAR